MLKRNTVLALGFAAFAALSLSNPAAAATLNGNSSSGVMFDAVTLQAAKLALPDGTELAFR